MGLLFVYRNNIRFVLSKNKDIYLVLDTQNSLYYYFIKHQAILILRVSSVFLEQYIQTILANNVCSIHQLNSVNSHQLITPLQSNSIFTPRTWKKGAISNRDTDRVNGVLSILLAYYTFVCQKHLAPNQIFILSLIKHKFIQLYTLYRNALILRKCKFGMCKGIIFYTLSTDLEKKSKFVLNALYNK